MQLTKESVLAAIEKVRSQGEAATNGPRCVYVNKDQQCCIVGWMLPDNETREKANKLGIEIGDSGVRSLWLHKFEPLKNLTREELAFLEDLQRMHDLEINNFGIDIAYNNMLERTDAFFNGVDYE